MTGQRNRRSASSAGSLATTRTSAGTSQRKKSVQPDKAGRYAAVEVDPETGNRKPSEGKGTGEVTAARQNSNEARQTRQKKRQGAEDNRRESRDRTGDKDGGAVWCALRRVLL